MVGFTMLIEFFSFIISKLFKDGKKGKNLNVANHVVQALVLCS
jgi:hypothetical protein